MSVLTVVVALLFSGGCREKTGDTSPVPTPTPTPAPPAPSPARTLAALEIVQELTSPGYPGIKSTQLLKIRAMDAAGAALPGVSVTIPGDASNGWFYPNQPQTAADGTVSFVWVPGRPGSAQPRVTATFNGVTVSATVTVLAVNPPTLPLSALNVFLSHSGAASGYSIDLTPLTDPRGTYFAALVWAGGYTGLQRDGSLYHDQVQFSVWDAGARRAEVVRAGPGLSCVRFGGEGTGQACSLDYRWSVGSTYRFEVALETVATGREVTLHLTSLGSGERRFVGTLLQGSPEPASYLNTFVEQFHRVAPNCLEQPLRAYEISRPMAKIGESWTPLTRAVVARQEEPATICSNVSAHVEGGGLRVQIGAETASDPTRSQETLTMP